MQAIHTKYLGPTAAKGARVRAASAADSIVIGWDHALDDEGNHVLAARELQAKIASRQKDKHWLTPMVSGCLPDGTYAHVFAEAGDSQRKLYSALAPNGERVLLPVGKAFSPDGAVVDVPALRAEEQA